jgi:hypothetical protein
MHSRIGDKLESKSRAAGQASWQAGGQSEPEAVSLDHHLPSFTFIFGLIPIPQASPSLHAFASAGEEKRPLCRT